MLHTHTHAVLVPVICNSHLALTREINNKQTNRLEGLTLAPQTWTTANIKWLATQHPSFLPSFSHFSSSLPCVSAMISLIYMKVFKYEDVFIIPIFIDQNLQGHNQQVPAPNPFSSLVFLRTHLGRIHYQKCRGRTTDRLVSNRKRHRGIFLSWFSPGLGW